jgi:transcriptional regulator with XRE-family HTH domain
VKTKTFESRLAELIAERGWSHAEAAEAVGVSIHTLRSWLKPKAASGRGPSVQAQLAVEALRVPGRIVYGQQGHVEVTYRAHKRDDRWP